MKHVSRLILTLLVVSAFDAGTARAESFDETISALMYKHRVPGLSLAIIKDGVIVKAKGYGVADLKAGTPVTPDTLFQAGSVSKPVTSVGALRLVDQHKLSLDTDVNTVLRGWHLPDNEFTAGNPVTLRQLLNHTAGITVHGFPGYAVDAPQPTLLQVLDGQPPANTKPIRVDLAPGTKWRYSGGGYLIVQQMILDVSGQSFPDFMQATVLDPLGMHASTFAQPLPAPRAALTASGYLYGGKPVPGRWHVYPEMAPAGLWTTPSDLARFVIALQKSLAGAPDSILALPTAREMVTRGKGNFGLGLHLSGSAGSEQFEHNGRDEGFDTMLLGYREGGLGAVVMFNTNDDSSFLRRVMDAIAKEYAWPGHVYYSPPQPLAEPAPAITEQVKTAFLAAQAGRVETSLLTPEYAAALATVVPGETTNALQALGPLKSITLIGSRNEGKNHGYRHYVVCEKDAVIVDCSFNPEGKICAAAVRPE